MEQLILICMGISFALAVAIVVPVRRLSVRIMLMDSPGSRGHEKELRAVPNTGGIAITLAIFLPVMIAVMYATIFADSMASWGGGFSSIEEHTAGIQQRIPMGANLFACLLGLHIIGFWDDRIPLPAWIKLAAVILAAIVMGIFGDTRLLVIMDNYSGGLWISLFITCLWFGVVTNAINFLDNMDGVCATVGGISSLGIAVLGCIAHQWFVAAMAAMMAGAAAGFFLWNRPPARIFMGDAGSLVVGFLLAFLTVRLTYVGFGETGGIGKGWYALAIPIFMLLPAIYDFTTVVCLRLLQGRSPLVGDQQHLTHRLSRRGWTDWGVVIFIGLISAGGVIVGIALAVTDGLVSLMVGVCALIGIVVLYLWDHSELSGLIQAGREA